MIEVGSNVKGCFLDEEVEDVSALGDVGLGVVMIWKGGRKQR